MLLGEFAEIKRSLATDSSLPKSLLSQARQVGSCMHYYRIMWLLPAIICKEILTLNSQLLVKSCRTLNRQQIYHMGDDTEGRIQQRSSQ